MKDIALIRQDDGEVIFVGNHCKSEVYTAEVEITCAKHSVSYQVLCFNLVGKDQVFSTFGLGIREVFL